MTNRGPVSFAEDLLDAAEGSGVKVFALFGNMDTHEVRELFEQRGVSIHLRKVKLSGGWVIAGFGGSGPTPFGTLIEFPEDEIYKGLAGLGIGAKTVLATHAPPRDASGLDYARGKPVGSSAIRRIIEERQPAASLCGHIHENEGEATIGRTKVIKVGAAMDGRAVELEVGKGISANFIDL